ncbi:hypothetical protein [Nocardiopsis lambiniae]|uniref:Biopolymer transporter ExbD n=1 Tax=Nocardiopsis lambiniae TaxID=3075539 RepID=A0ABU2M2P3_9ACTN|nr:hypothetical protein [Nocardiopsis sp. DSM 44743]MDT0326862.1 hypothetical protein [Nocardiopsis sp. DSM 44743]
MRDGHLSTPTVAIAGWLFADLLLAFLIITLGMDSRPPAEPDPVTEEVVEPVPHGLDLDPIVVELQGVSPAGAAAGEEEIVEELREALLEHDLADREAGMVLTFGANGGPAEGERFASDINGLLPRVHPGVFDDAVTRTFHSLGGSVGWLRIEIYLFAASEPTD